MQTEEQQDIATDQAENLGDIKDDGDVVEGQDILAGDHNGI